VFSIVNLSSRFQENRRLSAREHHRTGSKKSRTHLAVQLAGSCLARMGGGFLYPLLIFVATSTW